ncbi:unnamed protein product [Heterobilharzia americana]|nr:unnamed protein product [Heterobilharzia americana]
MLTKIIHELQPPSHLFAFTPFPSESMKKNGHGRSITMVFQSSDIDSAARYCVSSLENALGTETWYSSIILVEESVHKRFIDRVENIISSCISVSSETVESKQLEYPLYCLSYFDEIVSQISSVGAKVLCLDGKIRHFPFIVHDITPSFVKVRRHIGPVGFVLCFRSVKESVSLLKYFSDQFNNFRLSNVTSTSWEPVVNIWQTDSNVIWQLFEMLWLSGVDNVFVNASSRQLSTTMYAKLFEINGSLSFLRGNLKLETETTYATVTSLVSAANTAQLTWISKGYESIQCELLRSGISPGIPLEKEAFKYFVRHTHQLLGDPCRLFLTSKRQGTLLVPIAHFCLKPTGPIALVVDCRFLGNLKNCTFILKIIFCSLFAGNSIVLFVTNIEGFSVLNILLVGLF